LTESLRSPKVRRYLPSYGEKEDILLRLLSEEIGHVRKALAKSMLEHKWIKRAGTRERKFGDYSNSGNLYKLDGLGKQIAMRAQKLRENQEETSTVETEQRLARSRIEKVLKELEAEEKDIAYFRTALFALLLIFRCQRLDYGTNVPFHDHRKIAEVFANAVVGETILGKVIRADLLTAIPGADLPRAQFSTFLGPALLFCCVEAAAEQTHGRHAVTEL